MVGREGARRPFPVYQQRLLSSVNEMFLDLCDVMRDVVDHVHVKVIRGRLEHLRKRLKNASHIYHLNIIELAMYVSRVLDRQLLNGLCHSHENCRLCSRPHSHESVISSYFWDSYFLSYGEFIELINMHAMKLRVQALRAARAEPCNWSEGRYNNVGVSLRERRGTTQVMLGVSLRAGGTQL